MKVLIPLCFRFKVRPEFGWQEVLKELPQEFAEQAREDLDVVGEAKEYFKAKLLTLPADLKTSQRLQDIVRDVIYSVSDIQNYGLSVSGFLDDYVVVVIDRYRHVFLRDYYSLIYPVIHSELHRLTNTGGAVEQYLAPYDVLGENEVILI